MLLTGSSTVVLKFVSWVNEMDVVTVYGTLYLKVLWMRRGTVVLTFVLELCNIEVDRSVTVNETVGLTLISEVL